MKIRFVIYPYKVESESAHRLKDSLKEAGHKAIIVYPDGKYSWVSGDLVIGWGNSHEPTWASKAIGGVLNHWNAVELSIDKKKAFEKFKKSGLNIPEITENPAQALKWLLDKQIVLGRKQLRGMKGQGIEVIKKTSELPQCKLYTKFIPRTREFRIYVFGDKVIDVLEKRRLKGSDDPGYVRSEENGWVFCRKGVSFPKEGQTNSCIDVAVKAVKALGLYFAGVDVLWSLDESEAYVLETNTCPDIFGSGVPIFRDAFINLAKEE